MDIPRGGVYVVLGEVSSLLTAMKKNHRWSNTHQDEGNDVLMRGLTDLKDVLNQINDLRELDPNHFLGPFLEIVKSEETTSLITTLALSAVLKFLNYNLIDPKCEYIGATVNNIANAITHAKFVGTDPNNDAIVLMKILQILSQLVLSPTGILLTNKCVCDILLSCFRICFEGRLNDILRKFAESCLKDMVQLLFTRLPTFSEETTKSYNIKKLKMRRSSMESVKHKTKRKHTKSESKDNPGENLEESKAGEQPTVLDMQGAIHQDTSLHQESSLHQDTASQPQTGETEEDMNERDSVVINMLDPHQTTATQDSLEDETKETSDLNLHSNGVVRIDSDLKAIKTDETPPDDNCLENQPLLEPNESTVIEITSHEDSGDSGLTVKAENYQNITSISGDGDDKEDERQEIVNSQGVRFTASSQQQDGLEAYGLVCVQQLLRLLASLCNPLDKQNSVEMLTTGLALVTVALQVGADSIGRFPSLLQLVKDDLCRSLFSLLDSERLSVFSSDVQVCFLLFESLRTHLKFQFQSFLSKLTDIIVSDSSKISYEMREISLETVVQLWRIPGLVTELYLNYDCDLYCPNLLEQLTNLLSKNAFPVAGVFSTHLLSLDALLTVIDSIESHCHSRILNQTQQTGKQDEEKAMSEVVDPATNYILRETARHRISSSIPSHEQIMAIKRKKKLLTSGTEQFNVKPKKGIEFLQEQGLLSTPLDPEEVVVFLRENPHLDKKMIGDYISTRANLPVLNSFVKSFDFTDTRIDDALRLYLESFRLPGESLLISLVMEHFADHWHKCNGEPFASADAAFTLAYAIIMLNVDQHNHNVRRQNIPMTIEDFKRNLKNVNGGQNFEEKLLEDIYEAIKCDEIVMPAEQTGLVRENYIWKTMLRRGAGKDGIYLRAPAGLFDHNLFTIIWSPTVAALSFLFDKTNDAAIYQKAISGYRKCAMISAHYGMSSEFDNLIVSLCKFTTLLSSLESGESVCVLFGGNGKARLAARAVFHLAHRHGDLMRTSWSPLLDCVLQLYRCKLLPKILVEAEDFIELSGKISLMREDIMSQMSCKTETGLFSSLYSYIALGTEGSANKGPSPEDQEAIKLAQNCVRECHLEQLITESKFLRFESLDFFIKALMRASYGPEGHVSLGSSYSESTAVFFLELLLKVIIQNRDRVGEVWPRIKEHIYTLMMGAAACNHQFLVERCVVGLLRLAIRLMRREDISPVVLQSLRMLLLLKGTLSRVSRQVSYGMFELLKTSAANIHAAPDWAVIFTLLECVGAGAPTPRVLSKPPNNDSGAKSEGEWCEGVASVERGYTSDSQISRSSGATSPDLHHSTTGWILVGKDGEIQAVTGPRVVEERDLAPHDPFALVKCCEALSFLVRDVAHITPYNFENCVRCIRTFVQAALYITCEKKTSKKHSNSRKKGRGHREVTSSAPGGYDADESDNDDAPTGYQQVCIQLMDLMFTLHTRTGQIFRWWAEEEGSNVSAHTSLWQTGWCPLLEAISSLCTHPDRQVRMSAITYLQRGLLVSDLAVLSAGEWEQCFTRVLFPLLTRMLEPHHNPGVIEEARIRAATVLSKVFLHHLTALMSLPSFLELWLAILDFMDKYMHADQSDLLYEAVPESLKNMLLVMDSSGLFSNPDGSRNELWALTWDRISAFLPNLQQDLFRPPPQNQLSHAQSQVTEHSIESGEAQPVSNQTLVEPQPTGSSQPVDSPQPASSPLPLDSIQPVGSPLPMDSSWPVGSPLPTDSSQPVGSPQSMDSSQPMDTSQLVGSHQPASSPHPVGSPQPETPPGIEHVSTSPPISPSHSASVRSDPVTASLVATPRNWTPPAPLFPHIGQILSTPIGRVSCSPEEVSSSSLPVYCGFANTPSAPPPPSAQFFYQDMPSLQEANLQPTNVSSSGSILKTTVMSSQVQTVRDAST